MPKIKTEILGSSVEINYEETEKDRLQKIIENFNNRLLDFKNLEGKVADNKILFLAALKAEDQILDLINYKFKKEKENLAHKTQVMQINNLNQEIIKLKDIINALGVKNNDLKDLNSKAFDELEKIETQINNLINRIKLNKNDND